MDSRIPDRTEIETLIGLSRGWRRYSGLALLFLAIVSGFAGLWLFPQPGRANTGWLFYVISVGVFLFGLFLLFGWGEKTTNRIVVNWKYVLTGLLISGLAIFMRLYMFSSIPYGTWFDEADIGLNAVKIVEGTGELPVYNIGLQSQPLHFTYLVSLSFRLFGENTLSIRIVSAVFGLLGVGAAYLLGNEIRGSRFGLILAFFFAAGRWHVTFSRLGFITVTTSFFLLITFFFLFRALRTKKPLDFGLGGAALGFGLDFAIAFRVIPIAVLLYFVYWVVQSRRNRSNSSIPGILWTINAAVFMIGIGLTVAPVAQYAVRQPENFWSRTSQVSIFQTREEPDLGRALMSNSVEHLLMFNYKGDRNGRHNLPGEPILDPISGVLFVLGLGLVLSRLKQPIEFSFLVIFVLGLATGIFSLDFESPQAQRSAVAIPAVYFFTSLAFESIWLSFRRSGSSQIRLLLLTSLLMFIGAAVVYLNAHTYFVRQARDPHVWYAHNATETMAGIEMRKLNPDETSVYLSMFLQNHIVIQFLAPDFTSTKIILPPDVLTLREQGDKSVTLLIEQDQAWVVDAVLKLYPGVSHTVYLDPIGNPVLHKIFVPVEKVQAIQGVTARFWEGNAPVGEPSFLGPEKNLDFYWPGDSPIALPFTAEWEGILYVPQFSEYQFRLDAPGEAAVWLDDLPIIHKDNVPVQPVTVQLAQGNHSLRVQATGGEGPVQLAWRSHPGEEFGPIPAMNLFLSPPVFSNGLVGSYYEGGDWDSDPAIVRIDPFINMYFHIIPLLRPYGVEWEGEIDIPDAGEYEFGLRVNGQAQLYINDELVVDASQPTEYTGARINLGEGRNRIRLRFLDYLGASRIHLYWTKPGDIQKVIPGEVLFPR